MFALSPQRNRGSYNETCWEPLFLILVQASAANRNFYLTSSKTQESLVFPYIHMLAVNDYASIELVILNDFLFFSLTP